MKFFILLFSLFIHQIATTQPPSIVPQPQQLEVTNNTLQIKTKTNISIADQSLLSAANLLKEDISKVFDFHLNVKGKKGTIHLQIDKNLAEEHYQIEVTDRILITGANYEAVVMGTSSLLQMVKRDGQYLVVPKGKISDFPANSFRSLMLDVARQPTTLETLKQAVDLCRLYKVRYLQIHFSDDQSYTFPSKHYPEIVTKDHSYTLAEMKELAAFAKQRGIEIIPEIDGPGHSTSVRKALPEVFGSGDFSVMDMTSDTMYQAMKILFAEMVEVFNPNYLHIGADEAHLSPTYLNDPKVKKYMEERDYDGEDLKREYVLKMDQIIKSLGKKTMAWESFKASNEDQKVQLPNDILVNAWETLYESPQNYLQAGFDIINTSWKPYYTVRMHRWHPEYIYNFTKYDFANHWRFAPSYHPFKIKPSAQIKGGQMCAWEQFDVQQIEGLRHRIPAFAEYYWLEGKRPGYADFEKRMQQSDVIFEKLISAATVEISGTQGIDLSKNESWDGEILPNPNGLQNNSTNFFTEKAVIKIQASVTGANVHYTTDGSMPTRASKLYQKSLEIKKSTHLRFKVYSKQGSELGFGQYVFEHRPVHAKLDGIVKDGRAVRPYYYRHEYELPLTIAFESIAKDIEIRYTLDGSEPTMTSTLYKDAFQLASLEEIKVRARAFKNGQAFGDEWRPADYYDFVRIYKPSQHYRFKGIAKPRVWKIKDRNSIIRYFDEGKIAYKDNIELSGKRVAGIVTYDVDTTGNLNLERQIFFPQLHPIIKEDDPSWYIYRAYVKDIYGDEILPRLYLKGKEFSPGKLQYVHLDGNLNFTHYPSASGLALKRTLYPSTDERLFIERWELRNTTSETMNIDVAKLKLERSVMGKNGRYTQLVESDAPDRMIIASGETYIFHIQIKAKRVAENLPNVGGIRELKKRKALLAQFANSLILETPNSTLNMLFEFAKIRASESIFESDLGLIHSPGGGRYYVGIWANDQAEYVSPFFPYLGYEIGNESALNCYRAFAKEINPEYKAIRYAFEVEGQVPPFLLDRGDAAMIAYGASQFVLANGEKAVAEELWPLIEWCLEYSHRQLNEEGVVKSESDEMEGRIETGNANLSTSSLYYGALNLAIDLARSLEKEEEQINRYQQQSTDLKSAIESYFGATVEGLKTYKYYKEHEYLRHWICLPLVVGIFDRKEATTEALFERLWSENGVHVEKNSDNEAISKIFWDRGTLYALRGTFLAGATEQSLEKLISYSEERLIGDRVPFPVEAYPEGAMAHLSAESGLYCRIFTEGLFGIVPTGFNSFQCTPRLPKDWEQIKLKNIKAFGKDFNLLVNRVGEGRISVKVVDNSNGEAVMEKSFSDGETFNVKF